MNLSNTLDPDAGNSQADAVPFVPEKHPLRSVTVWGSLLAVAGLALQAFGLDDLAAEVVTLGQPIVSAIDSILIAVGAVVAIVGRFRATTRVTLKPHGKAVGSGLAVALLLTPAMAGGCVQSRQQQLDGLEATSTVIARSAVTASVAGLIDDEQFGEFYRLYRPAAAALVAARPLVDADPRTFDEFLASARVGLTLARSLLIDLGVIAASPSPPLPQESRQWPLPSSSPSASCLPFSITATTSCGPTPPGADSSPRTSAAPCVPRTTPRWIGWTPVPASWA